MRDLLNVFSPCADEEMEQSRQTLLWECLVCTCKYISAYRSRSAANNSLGLDDVSAVVPGALRMSIHNKSPDNGVQFPIKVGVNPHRTPWHGSAELRWSKNEKSMVIDAKLAAEMWSTHAAVLPSVRERSEEEPCRQPLDTRAEAWERYAAKLAEHRQPLFFADVLNLPSEWYDDVILARPAKAIARDAQRMKKKRAAAATVGGA